MEEEITLELLRNSVFDLEIPNFEKWNPDNGRPRRWFKLDVHFYADPKIRGLPVSAVGLLVLLLGFRARSEGHLRDLTLTSLGLHANFQGTSVGLLLLKLLKLKLCRITAMSPRLEENRLDQNRIEEKSGKPVTKSKLKNPEIPLSRDSTKSPKPASPSVALATAPCDKNPVGYLIGVYVEAWRLRYQSAERPGVGGKEQGILKRLLGVCSVDKLAMLLQAYCQIDDKWFNTKHHDLATFEQNLNRVILSLEKGRSNPTERTWEDIVKEQKDDLQKLRAGELTA